MNDIATIPNMIYEIRRHKVMLDSDLANLYGVPVKALNQAVKRNSERFPADFMFQLTIDEVRNLKSQFVTSSWGGRRTEPFAFTENGVAMLSAILKSQRAIDMSITIIRAFVKMRQLIQQQSDHSAEIKELKQMLLLHIDHTDVRFKEHDDKIRQIVQVLNNLIEQPKKEYKIGFNINRDK